MTLPEFSLKKPVTIVVIMIIFLTIGFISLRHLPLEMMPDTSFPGLSVRVSYPSSSPEEVERTIVRPLEDKLSTLSNLKRISSRSSSDGGRIFIEFDTGTNMELMAMAVRDKVDQVRGELPEDLDKIYIYRWSSSDHPVISMSLSIAGNQAERSNLVENIIRPELERIEGVANVDSWGLRNKQVLITLKPEAFKASSLSITDLASAIGNNNSNISAGKITEQQEYVVRVPGEFSSVDEVSRLPLNQQGLRLQDVADVAFDYPEITGYYRLNGRDAMGLQVYRASAANVVDVCRQVKAALVKLKHSEPRLADMSILYYHDQSKEILQSLNDLSLSGLIGGVLAVLVLLFFLRKLRSTLIIATAIPSALVFTFSLMYLYREAFSSSLSINIISLSGLMLAVGMLVDASVVVLENIFRYRQEMKLPPKEAAIRGSREVAMAVSASTLTTMVVFVSLTFIAKSGFGRFMRDFAITVSLALVATLMVSLSFIPLASSRLLKGATRAKARWLVGLTRGYEKIIGWTIKTGWTKLATLTVAIAVLVAAVVMLSGIEQEYMPHSEERTVGVVVYMPQSWSLERMDAMFSNMEEQITARRQELAVDNFTTDFDVDRVRQGRYRGSLALYLTETGPTVAQVSEKLKELFPSYPGVTFEFGERRGRHGFGSGFRVELRGKDFTTLTELVPIVTERLRALPEVTDVSSDLEGGDTQLLVTVDRHQAEQLGISSRRVARSIQYSLSERPIGVITLKDQEYDIVLRVQGAEGFAREDLKNLGIRGDKQVPLSAVSDFSYRIGSTSIEKENKQSELDLTVNSEVKGMVRLSRVLTQALDTVDFPEGYSWGFGRRWERFRESQESSKIAYVLALVFVYIIMASLFESFLHPFTILLTVPLALFGVALFFNLFGITMNDVSNLGILILMGIVVNNGIILIDHIRGLRKSGLPRREAIIAAGSHRLRPILMTAITTIFGVLPLAVPVMLPHLFEATQGRAQMWAPISIAIIGGLTTSTFFTLIVLPTFYAIFDSLARRTKGLFGLPHKV